MILMALKELAEVEGLIDDPDFEPKPVSWIIELSPEGQCLGYTANWSEETGKRLPGRRFVPKTRQRSGQAPPAQFLYENSKYIFGAEIDRDGAIVHTDERLDDLLGLVETAFHETGDEGLRAVTEFLRVQRNKQDRSGSFPQDYRSGDWFVFRLAGDEGLVSDRPLVRSWWKGRRGDAGDPTSICLITGEPCVPVDKHDPIKKISKQSTSGVAIVTFNSPAFESYGLNRNENAPISRAAAEAYTMALNRLLDPDWPDPKIAGQKLPRRNIRLNNSTKVVFWAASTLGDFADVFEEVFSRPDPEVVGRLVTAPKSGKAPFLDDNTPFYALTISGGQGRATIRDWVTSSVAEMAGRVRGYFEDISLVFPFENPPLPSINWLLRSVALRGEDENIPPNLAAEVFQAILRDRPFPVTLLRAALARCKAEGVLSPNSNGSGFDWSRSHLRMQVIKSVLVRMHRHQINHQKLPEVYAMLDESNRHPAYLLGRLFSLLELLQADAQGEINATVADRFFGAASTAPVTVFPRLLRLSRHHLSKLRKDNEKRGVVIYTDRLIGQVMDMLPAKEFPSVFSMEEQGLFAVGYYQQRQARFSKKSSDSTEIHN